jgi:hypothetical protein
MFRAVGARILSDESIDRIFVENSERQVTSDVLLSCLVELLSSVVTKKQPSISVIPPSWKGSSTPMPTSLFVSMVRALAQLPQHRRRKKYFWCRRETYSTLDRSWSGLRVLGILQRDVVRTFGLDVRILIRSI